MAWFKRKGKSEGGAAVAERPGEPLQEASREVITAEIRRLSAQNAEQPDREVERRLLRLRHLASLRLVDERRPRPDFAAPAGGLPEGDPLPEVAAADLTPELLRAGILRDGCLLVRGLVPREEALRLADRIDEAFAVREELREGGNGKPGFYEEFQTDERYGGVGSREWIREGGGVLAVDSPLLAFELFRLLEAARFPQVVEGYLGEPPVISAEKTTLRKATPDIAGAWHQDGKFMGDVRALNLWLSLSRCGDEAPGLDLVPTRLDEFVKVGGDDAVLDFQVSSRTAREAAGEKGVIRPIFEPGDALLFDEMFLHQTGSDPSMPKPRYAVESWFFGTSAFAADYAPIAV